MGSKGFNGSITSVVFDVTRDTDLYVLNNHGNNYELHSNRRLQKSLDDMLISASDKDEFVLWYDCYII